MIKFIHFVLMPLWIVVKKKEVYYLNPINPLTYVALLLAAVVVGIRAFFMEAIVFVMVMLQLKNFEKEKE